MAKSSHLYSVAIPNAGTICLFLFLAITLGCASSARILDDVDTEPSSATDATPSSGQIPATTTGSAVAVDADDDPTDVAAAPVSTAAHDDEPPPPLSFFMHDILGGSHPSGRVVTGIIANSGSSGVPFSKPNSGVFPISGGVPLVNGDNSPIVNSNNNNAPVLAGLNGVQSSAASAAIQSNGNNGQTIAGGGNNQPFVTAGQLPAGATLQQLMFGTITAVDDELTEGHELGAAVVGRAQGFYLASSLDGTSQTVALTATFHGGDHHGEEEDEEDSLSFFGIHRAGSPESQIAVVGGTGKYEKARGYANIETLHHEDEHTTDGVETILQFSVYLSH